MIVSTERARDTMSMVKATLVEYLLFRTFFHILDTPFHVSFLLNEAFGESAIRTASSSLESIGVNSLAMAYTSIVSGTAKATTA